MGGVDFKRRARQHGGQDILSPDTFGCCALAASGHAAAAPPSEASNSRRPLVTVMRPSRTRVPSELHSTAREELIRTDENCVGSLQKN